MDPYFWPVHGSLFSDRSMDAYFLTGPRIPIFWPVHGSLDSYRSIDPYFCFQIRPDWNQTKIWFSSGPDIFQILIWIQSGRIWRKKNIFCPDKIQISIWTRKKSGRSCPDNLDQISIWTTFAHLWSRGQLRLKTSYWWLLGQTIDRTVRSRHYANHRIVKISEP